MLPSRARQAMMVNLHPQPPPLPHSAHPSDKLSPFVRNWKHSSSGLPTCQAPGGHPYALGPFNLSKGVWLTPPHGGIKKLCQGQASFATSEHHVCWHCKIAEEFNKRSFQNVHCECTKDSPKWVSSWPGELSGWEITSKHSAFAFPVRPARLLRPLQWVTHMDKGSRHLPLLSSVQWVHTCRDFLCWCLILSPTLAFYHIRRGPGPIHPCRNPHSPPNTSHLMFRGSHARGSSIMAVEASSSLLHHLLCATPPAWQLVRVWDRTGADAKRDPCVEAEWSRSLLPSVYIKWGWEQSTPRYQGAPSRESAWRLTLLEHHLGDPKDSCSKTCPN